MAESLAGQLKREREETRALLADGYAQDHIDQDELERRLDLVETAATVEELRALTTELRPMETALVPVRAATQERIPVTLGSLERAGAWQVSSRTTVRVLFGSAELDLREAVLPPGDIEIEVKVVFGNLELIVPPGWQIDNRCGAVLGSIEQDPSSPVSGPRRVLRLTGRVVFSSLAVYERLPGEGSFGAWRRRRGEKKALAERSARALRRGDE
ncbi:MAG TPA: LiaF domain-containing protein [Nannocystis sp.]|jgi:hypothetical protein